MMTHVVHEFKVGFVIGEYILVLFHIDNENGQECEIHEVCGKTICIGEVACIERELQTDREEVLRGYRLRDGIKSCIFGHVKINDLAPRIVSYFNGMLVQVFAIDEDESQAVQNSLVDGVIKIARKVKKDKTLK